MVYNLLFSLIFGSLAGWKLTNTNNTLETNIQRIQGRRNRGGHGGQPPPKFCQVPFSGSKVPFSCVKNVIKIAFFAQKNTFENLNLCYLRKMVFILWKNIIYPENFLLYQEIFFHI